MSREDYQQKLADEARVQPQTHKKMYKSKKRWFIAGMTALAVGGATAMAPEDVTTLMSDVYQTAEEVVGGGVAYAATAATAAVNTTTAVTVTDSGVASVTSGNYIRHVDWSVSECKYARCWWDGSRRRFRLPNYEWF